MINERITKVENRNWHFSLKIQHGQHDDHKSNKSQQIDHSEIIRQFNETISIERKPDTGRKIGSGDISREIKIITSLKKNPCLSLHDVLKSKKHRFRMSHWLRKSTDLSPTRKIRTKAISWEPKKKLKNEPEDYMETCCKEKIAAFLSIIRRM